MAGRTRRAEPATAPQLSMLGLHLVLTWDSSYIPHKGMACQHRHTQHSYLHHEGLLPVVV